MNKVLTYRFYCNPTDEDFDATKGLGVNFSSDSDNLFTLTLMIFNYFHECEDFDDHHSFLIFEAPLVVEALSFSLPSLMVNPVLPGL